MLNGSAKPTTLGGQLEPDSLDRRLSGIIIVVFLVIVGLLMGHVMERLDPVTGDEPFYLVTAGSILRDRDIDETNNWKNQDVNTLLPPVRLPPGWNGWPQPARGFPPHSSDTVQPILLTKHGLGLSVLIVPFMAAGGRTAIVWLLGAIGALVAANIFLLARRVGAGRGGALTITAALALTTPVLPYSFLIFPELPAALATIYPFRRLLAERNTVWQSALMGSCVALLPWLHARLAIIAVALGLMALVRQARHRDLIAAVPGVLLPSASAAGLILFYWYFYGRPWPNTQDHAGMADTAFGWAVGAVGLLLDQQWGLLIHAPVYFLAGAGLIALWRSHRHVFGWLVLVAVPYFLFISGYNQWWGEWCPPARYLATLVPLAAAPIGALWARDRSPITPVLTVVLALVSYVVMVTFLADPQLMYNHPTGRSNLLAVWSAKTNVDWTAYVPSYVVTDASPNWLRLTWIIAADALLILLTIATDVPDSARARRAPSSARR